MLKKLFALATITAFTGLGASTMVAGCSSTEDGSATGTDAATDARRDVNTTRPDAAEPEPEDTGPAVCPAPSGTFTAALFEQEIGVWKPSVISAACTQADIDKGKAALASGSATFASIKTALGATCGACAFGKPTDANWKPIIEIGQGAIINWGGCFGAYSKSDACGKGITQGEVCFNVVCSEEDCGSQQAQRSCGQKANGTGGDCNEFAKAQASCGQDDAVNDVCGSLLSNIAFICGGGLDGGLDASTGP